MDKSVSKNGDATVMDGNQNSGTVECENLPKKNWL